MKLIASALIKLVIIYNGVSGEPLQDMKLSDPNDPNLQRMLLKDQYLELPLESYQEMQYFSVMKLGSQGQDLRFVMDTGSNWHWVTSNLCYETGDCDNIYSQRFDVRSSKFISLDRIEEDPTDLPQPFWKHV